MLYHDYLLNTKAEGDCQYNLYCENTTYRLLNSNGSVCADTCQVALSIEIELPAGHHLNRHSELVVHEFDFRRLKLQPVSL